MRANNTDRDQNMSPKHRLMLDYGVTKEHPEMPGNSNDTHSQTTHHFYKASRARFRIVMFESNLQELLPYSGRYYGHLHAKKNQV